MDTSRVDETFIEPDATETTSILQLRQKVKRDKITALYKHLNVTDDPDLADINRFMIKKFKNRCWFSALERSFKAATKLMRELPTDIEMESIPLEGISSLVEDIHVKTREASQNTDLDMKEFLGIDKALQSIHGELLNNASKLKEINKRIKRDIKKLQEVENDPTYSDEQRQLCKDRLDD